MPTPDARNWDLEADLLVIGGVAGGMTAAFNAARTSVAWTRCQPLLPAHLPFDQRNVVWSALMIRRHRTAPTVSACLRKLHTRFRHAADGAWATSSSHVSSTAMLNLARSACAAPAR